MRAIPFEASYSTASPWHGRNTIASLLHVSSKAEKAFKAGGWLADEIQRRLFDWLDQPVERVSGEEASPSISKVLERAAIAGTEEIVAGLERVRVGMGQR